MNNVSFLPEESFLLHNAGFTPLMRACVVGDVGCLRVLLHHGASINCRVSISRIWQCVAVLKVLICHCIQDPQKTSPLHLAAVSGWTDCITELIISCHPVDCVDNKGWSPLLYAHFQNNQDCVLELMKVKPQQVRPQDLQLLHVICKLSPTSKVTLMCLLVFRFHCSVIYWR